MRRHLDEAEAPPDLSPVRHLARLTRTDGERTAVDYEGRRISYAELGRLAGGLAARLRRAGVEPGDRVAYAGLNSLDFLVAWFAGAWVGGVFVPLNFRLQTAELESILADAEPAVVIAEPEFAARLDPLLASGAIGTGLLIDDDPLLECPEGLSERWEPLSACRRGSAPGPVPRTQDDLAALFYTSGSTGRPKGVMLSHGNLWWSRIGADPVLGMGTDEVCYAVAPLFHIGGFNALVLHTLTLGGTVLVRRRFNAARVIREVDERHVTSAFMVPTMLTRIEQEASLAAADLGSLRALIVGGAPVPPDLIRRFAGRGVVVQQAWGLTETAPYVSCLPRSAALARIGSCGLPICYLEVRVVDPSTMVPVAAPGDVGEMCVRGPNVTPGYWRSPEATASSRLPGGWFRTGDLGYADEDGFLYLVDRYKDMIVSGGENIYPVEVENALAGHPLVRECAVIGVSDARWGETVCAFVSARGPITLDDVQRYLGSRIARYKIPSRLVVVDEIAHNGAGKVDKPALRRQAEGEES